MNTFEAFLHNWPIVQFVHSLFVLYALPPVILLLILLRNTALHVNCKFLLYAWQFAFLVSILSHAAFILCDIVTGQYIPESNENRLVIFGVHGFVHAFSSAQEFLFSIERTFACANPSIYHDRSLSITPLFFSEIAAIGVAFYYSTLLSAGGKLIMACLITNTIDCLSLLCLVITKIWTDRKKRDLILSGLNEKYQIREAFEITKVMLPCGLISLIMKLFAMSLGWIYGLGIIESRYAFTITSGLYFIIESANCIICSVIFLRTHPKLRRRMSLLLCGNQTKVALVQCRNNMEIHFNSLQNDWK